MRKLNLILLSTLFCAAAFFVSRAQAQAAAANVTFTVQLSGEGARLGRLSLNYWPHGAQAPLPLGECPFRLVDGQTAYSLLSPDQLSCSFSVPINSFIIIGAKKDLQASDRDWTVGFSSWGGFCLDQGNFVDAEQLYYCEGNIGESTSLTASFATISGSPELDPSAVVGEYLNTASKGISRSLMRLNLKRFAKGRALKIKLASAPATGKLSLALTSKSKKKTRNKARAKAAFITAPASVLTLALARTTLIQGVSANLRLRPTAIGKAYMRGKSQMPVKMTMRFIPSGSRDVVTQIKSLLMRRR